MFVGIHVVSVVSVELSQNFSLCQEKTRTPPQNSLTLQATVTMTSDPTSHWPLECLFWLFHPLQTAVTMTSTEDVHTHTCPHTRMHTLLYFPCCFQNVSSAWAVLIVLIVMNFLYIWRWILYYCYYYYYCGHSFSAHFWVGVDSTLLFPPSFHIDSIWKKKCNDNNNNSSSNKDDNSWLDECFSICV